MVNPVGPGNFNSPQNIGSRNQDVQAPVDNQDMANALHDFSSNSDYQGALQYIRQEMKSGYLFDNKQIQNFIAAASKNPPSSIDEESRLDDVIASLISTPPTAFQMGMKLQAWFNTQDLRDATSYIENNYSELCSLLGTQVVETALNTIKSSHSTEDQALAAVQSLSTALLG